MLLKRFFWKTILLYLLLINPYRVLLGQHVFHYTFGAWQTDVAYSVRETWDKGFIISGLTFDGLLGPNDMFLLKLDQKGQFQWYRTYGSSYWEFGGFVELTPDSGFLLVGTTYGFGITYKNFYIVKTDKHGHMEWDWKEGGVDGYDAVCTPDGGYLVVGSGEDSLDGNFNGWSFYLVKLDEFGNTEWTKKTSKSENDVARLVVAISDSSYVIAGSSHATTVAGYHGVTGYFVKINNYGKIKWERTLSHIKKKIIPVSLFAGEDGGFYSSSGYLGFAYFDSNGDLLWRDSSFYVNGVITNDGGFINTGGGKLKLSKYNASHVLEWKQAHDIGNRTHPRDIQQTSDDGYIITGNVDINNENNDPSETFIAKTDCEGNLEYFSPNCLPPQPEPPVPYQFYPNPFNNTTTINMPEAIQRFALFDVTGKLLFKEHGMSQKTYTLKATHLPAGVYLYLLSTEHNDYYGKVLKQHGMVK